ncbi:MAG: PQQ-dependent sugar dehydrogenase, partial [Chloroflexota bacterium]
MRQQRTFISGQMTSWKVSILLILGLLLGLFAAGLTGSVQADEAALEDPISDPIEQEGAPVELSTVTDGLTAPTWATAAPGASSERLFASDQDGILWSIDLETGEKGVFLDVGDRLVDLGIGGPGTYDERGLLGFAFHPDFISNGLLYTYTSEPVAGPADFSTMPAGVSPNHQSVITEWQVPEPSNPDSVVDPDSSREVLRIDQPQFNHNGGTVIFGPDDMLFVALGDGGGADDQGTGHVSGGNAQDPGNILGSILRIDPLGTNSVNGEYGIPSDNPFVGDPDALDETYAYGFRNPYRMSFDLETGDLYAGDVGQNDIEEVDVVTAGGNFGWRLKEGSFCFDPNGDGPGFVFDADPCP